MPGWIYLHPVAQAEKGIGLGSIHPTEPVRTTYLVPASRMVSEYRRLLHRFAVDEERVTVQTFDRFVRDLLPDPGRLMKPVEQELLVRQAVDQVKKEGLRYFQGMTDRRGWRDLVEARIGELKRAGVTPERLGELWRHGEDRYRELADVYRIYDSLLDWYDLWDHEEPYRRLIDRIRSSEVHVPERVIVEHFAGLSFLQEELLIQLVTAGVEVILHWIGDQDRPRLFQETARSVERLKQRGFTLRYVSDSERDSRKTSSLRHVEEQAFRSTPRVRDAEGAVEVIAAPGVDKETEQVVIRIKRWLRETGAALSDVAVMTEDPDTYHPRLFPQMKAAGLFCHQSFTRPLKEHPLMQVVLAALAVKRGREELRPVLLESPYLPWADGQGERSRWLSVYRQWGHPRQSEELLRRIREGFQPQPENENPSHEELDRLVQLYQWLEDAPLDHSWREWTEWFVRWLKPLNRRTDWMEMGQDSELLPLMAEEVKAWEGLCSIIREWQEVFTRTGLGERPCDAAAFSEAFEQAADLKKVEKIPGRRGGIRLLEPNQVRGDRYRAVFLLGCAEGEWPRPIREDWLVTDEERRRLREEGVGLALSSEQRNAQITPFFHCIQAATEQLVFSYPSATPDGKECLPSPYLEEVLRVFDSERVPRKSLSIADTLPTAWEDALSLSRSLERAIVTLRSKKGDRGIQRNSEANRALYVLEKLKRRNPYFHRILAERIRVERLRWGKEYTSFDGVLSPTPLTREMGRELANRIWSATLLNDLAQCRFHFFAGRILEVRAPEEREEGLSPLERGELMHRILCRFWDRYRERGLDPTEGEEAEEHLRAVTEAVFRQFIEEQGDERNPFAVRIAKNRLRGRLLSMLDHELAWRRKRGADEDVRPLYLELSFGLGRDPSMVERREIDPETREQPARLSLTGSRSIRLRGKVDRVDVDQEGYYVLYDYKSGGAPRTEEVMAGAHLQLPLYLWALQSEYGLDPYKAVGAAFYTAGSRRNGEAPTDNRNQGLWRKELADQVGIGRVKGLMPDEEWSEIHAGLRHWVADRLDRAERGDFAVDPSWECPTHCPHRGICRIDPHRMDGKEY
ncbi:PD-(D/E)XK nuclease family protein [Paludifilum halophilum]|uniref:Uncharacterized protein n=1 Tax=Paludifilum halophilum TaxID=1642702 RepID=A0A235B9A8_9BACL|nr:PD-(D/E)XK nuclease family protein [Paludifilum halophilum]OYD08874.1 hypothetical protein CHM34_03565 [Paludifilum halophilum]